MKNLDFVTDIAIESADSASIQKYCTSKEVDKNIIRHTLRITSQELSQKIGKPRGVYVTYDTKREMFSNASQSKRLSANISATLMNLIGIVKRTSPILVIGLGNGNIVADSLGEKVVDRVAVTRTLSNDKRTQSVCAFNVGVSGVTGIQSAEIVAGIADKIKPCVIIAVDSLATSVVSRVGTSFQISTSGITPGSGVGGDKDRIDKSLLGVPVISVGVPLMLSMRTALYSFMKDYSSSTGQSIDEFRLRETLADNNLLNLIVSPKETDFFVDKCSAIIASAINSMYAN